MCNGRPWRASPHREPHWDPSRTQAKSDPFSKTFDGGARLKKGDAGYGKAVSGSKTEARGQQAQAWVEAEIEKLVVVIVTHASLTSDSGQPAITLCAPRELEL